MSQGHPKALYYLFFAELWERFSYYGMRALLVLYIVQRLFADMVRADADTIAYGIYAAFGALVYATPVLGGMIADKFIGYRKSIMTGGILMAIGLFMMTIENQFFFFGGLGFLVTGNGLFKPNISSMVGSLYAPGDPRRDAGFTIFYMGINIGAWLSPLACGWIAYQWGWEYGFALAGVGMLLGLIVFQLGINTGVFTDKGLPPITEAASRKIAGISMPAWSVILSILAVPILSMLIFRSELAGYLLYGVLAMVVIIVGKSFIEITRVEREKIIAIFILAVFSTIFWSFFEQAGSTITLYAERNVDLSFINAAQTNMINPFFIIVLAIPFSMAWTWLATRKLNPYTPFKFAYGIAQLGLGFLIFAYGARFATETGQVPMLILIIGYFFITTGELFISPIGLSMVTRLSPAKVVSFMMGVWFLSMSFAHYIAGIIAKLTTQEVTANGGFLQRITESVTGLTPDIANENGIGFGTLLSYSHVFTTIAFVAFGVAVVALLLTPVIRKLMHGEH